MGPLQSQNVSSLSLLHLSSRPSINLLLYFVFLSPQAKNYEALIPLDGYVGALEVQVRACISGVVLTVRTTLNGKCSINFVQWIFLCSRSLCGFGVKLICFRCHIFDLVPPDPNSGIRGGLLLRSSCFA